MILAFLLLFFSAGAWASCGCVAGCPLDIRSAQEWRAKEVRVGYEFEFMDQNQPRIGTHKAAVGERRGHHDEERSINRIHRLTVSAAVTNRWSVDLALPYISRSHRHIHNHDDGDTMAQGWDFGGIGDLSVRTRYTIWKPSEKHQPTLSLIAGLEAPTGKTHVDNHDGSHAEPSITPGSDSWDFLAGFSTLQQYRAPMVSGGDGLLPVFFSLTHQWNGQGHEDYRLGRVLTLSAGTVYPVLTQWGVVTQLNVVHKGKEDAGPTHEEVGKTGGEFLYVTPGLQWRPTTALDISALVQLPVHQRVNEIQLTSQYNVLVSVGYRFQL